MTNSTRRRKGLSAATSTKASCCNAVQVSPSSSSCTQQQTCIQNFFVKKPKKRKLKTSTTTTTTIASAQTTTSPIINSSSSSSSNTSNSSGGGPLHAAVPAESSSSNDDNNSSNHNHSLPQLPPIITPPAIQQHQQRNTSNNNTKASKSSITSTSASTKKKKKKLQQMYLDFGQASFGKRSICKICGMLTVHGLAEDDQEHRKICKDFIHGVPFSISSTAARVVATTTTTMTSSLSKNNNNNNKPAKIIEIRPTDSKSLWNKMLQVRAIVDKELGFAQQSSVVSEAAQSSSAENTNNKEHCRWTTFLFISDKQRAVGLLSAELIRQAFALHDNNCERSTQARKAMLGIHTIWVHSKFRGQGIARQLVDTVREKMVYGLVVPVDQVAFSSPTEAGAKFARSYMAATTAAARRATTKANNNKSSSLSSSSSVQNDCVLVYDCGSC